jgi:hypothetical protein
MNRDPKKAAPPDGMRVMEWYAGSFEAVFCVLHPFVRVPSEAVTFFQRDEGPTREQVAEFASPVLWNSVIESSGLEDVLELDRLLRQLKGSLPEDDLVKLDGLRRHIDDEALLLPEKGDFSPLQLDKFLDVFERRCSGSVIVGDEFGRTQQSERVDSLLSRDYPVVGQAHPVLFPSDNSILIATHWDSFHTFFCGNRGWIEDDVQGLGLEGFFCDANTRVPLSG